MQAIVYICIFVFSFLYFSSSFLFHSVVLCACDCSCIFMTWLSVWELVFVLQPLGLVLRLIMYMLSMILMILAIAYIIMWSHLGLFRMYIYQWTYIVIYSSNVDVIYTLYTIGGIWECTHTTHGWPAHGHPNRYDSGRLVCGVDVLQNIRQIWYVSQWIH